MWKHQTDVLDNLSDKNTREQLYSAKIIFQQKLNPLVQSLFFPKPDLLFHLAIHKGHVFNCNSQGACVQIHKGHVFHSFLDTLQ